MLLLWFELLALGLAWLRHSVWDNPEGVLLAVDAVAGRKGRADGALATVCEVVGLCKALATGVKGAAVELLLLLLLVLLLFSLGRAAVLSL